jgi:hypothetical protein
LQKTSDPEEQKLLMYFFSNLTFFKKLRLLILEHKFDSIFEIQFRDPSLAKIVQHDSCLSCPKNEPLPPMFLQQTHYELISSLNNPKIQSKKQCSLRKKPSLNMHPYDASKFSKSEFKKNSIFGVQTDKYHLKYSHMNQKKVDFNTKPSSKKFKKSFVKLGPEIKKSEISLNFLSNIALANLTLDFNSFNFYKGNFNMVTSLFVYDYLNPFGKMKVFENLLNYLLHINHLNLNHNFSNFTCLLF